MAGVEQKNVAADETGMRLDRWFKVHFPGLGFGHLQKLLRSGQVRVDGGRVKQIHVCRQASRSVFRHWALMRRPPVL